jgi:hypothetical protein
MTTKDLLGMLFERGNAMQTFWGFYITVSAALLAFFGSAERSITVALVLSFAFVAFAYVNGKGMYDIARQRQAVFDLLHSFRPPPADGDAWLSSTTSPEAKRDLVAASKPPKPNSVAAFHVASDVIVLIALWLLYTLFPRQCDLF